jgi:quinoprotein glucose dehydrogenase
MRASVPAKACGLAALLALSTSVTFGFQHTEGSPAEGVIWNGVYTTARASRGKANYEKTCSECHNSDLNGTATAPGLHGDAFLKTWENGSTYALIVKLRDSMPADDPAPISDEVKIDVLAFLLQANGFPAGQSELKLNQKELEYEGLLESRPRAGTLVKFRTIEMWRVTM